MRRSLASRASLALTCLHTMYVDKPMQRHGLMQAIARVNRVFKDKPGGLVVDYLGLATQLQKAVTDYTESGGKGEPVEMQERAVAKMLELYEVCAGMVHGFDYSKYRTGSPRERVAVLAAGREHVLQQQDGKKRFMRAVSKLSKAFALSVPHERAIAIRDDVGFFQAVRAGLAKTEPTGGKSFEDLDTAVRQIVSKAVASDEVIDIFSAAGLKKPDISILSDEFLSEIKDLPHKNLAIETLRKLLTDEIKGRARKNLVQSRRFSVMLEESIRKYQNRSLQAAQVLQELIDLAKDMRQAHERGEKLGLSDEELAFYDALETNDSAVKVLGDETLKKIALELLDTVRKNTTIDWTVKESVRAKLRVMAKRILRKYGYPPDKQEQATKTVLQQAELLCKDWACVKALPPVGPAPSQFSESGGLARAVCCGRLPTCAPSPPSPCSPSSCQHRATFTTICDLPKSCSTNSRRLYCLTPRCKANCAPSCKIGGSSRSTSVPSGSNVSLRTVFSVRAPLSSGIRSGKPGIASSVPPG